MMCVRDIWLYSHACCICPSANVCDVYVVVKYALDKLWHSSSKINDNGLEL